MTAFLTITYGFRLTYDYIKSLCPTLHSDEKSQDLVRTDIINQFAQLLTTTNDIIYRVTDFAYNPHRDSTHHEEVLIVGIELEKMYFQYSGACRVPDVTPEMRAQVIQFQRDNPLLTECQLGIYVYSNSDLA